MGVYQAIRQEKVYKQGQLKLTHINFVILTIGFVKNIFRQLKTKFGHSCISFFQAKKLTIHKVMSVRKSYTFQSLLKNITVLPVDNSANSFIKNNF